MNKVLLTLSLAFSSLLCACAPRSDDSVLLTDSKPEGPKLSWEERSVAAERVCPLQDLVPRDDLMDIDFEDIGSNGRLFGFGGSSGGCALKLNGGSYSVTSFNPNIISGPYYFEFTVSSTSSADYCIPINSVWERISGGNSSPWHVIELERFDQKTGEKLHVSAYRAWQGTALAKRAKFRPMMCK
jgi:hypothetical protein